MNTSKYFTILNFTILIFSAGGTHVETDTAPTFKSALAITMMCGPPRVAEHSQNVHLFLFGRHINIPKFGVRINRVDYLQIVNLFN